MSITTSMFTKRMKKQELLRTALIKMNALLAQFELENPTRLLMSKEERAKTKRARIEMETAVKSIRDLVSNGKKAEDKFLSSERKKRKKKKKRKNVEVVITATQANCIISSET